MENAFLGLNGNLLASQLVILIWECAMNVNGVSANRLIQKTAEEKNSSQHRVLKLFEKRNNLYALCHSVRFNIVIQYPLVVLWKGVGQFVCAVCNNPVRERLNPEVIHLLSNELKAD